MTSNKTTSKTKQRWRRKMGTM